MTDATEATKSADCLAPASPWDTALAQHLAGRLAEAETGYRGILTAEPANAEALHMLGVLYFQSGQASEGLELLEAAIAIDDRSAPLHSHRGLILAALGRAGEAVQAYRAALALNPNMAETHNNLGSLLQISDDLPGAIEAYRRAVAIQPELVEAAVNLGLALTQAHEHAEAAIVLQRAAALRPGDAAIAGHLAAAHNNVGASLEASGQAREALAAYHRALAIQPEFPAARFNLGKSHAALGQYDEAIREYRQALTLEPDFAAAHNNLGIALFMRGQLDEAITSYQTALGHRPDCPHTLNNFGNALRTGGQLDQAIDTYQRAIAAAPRDAELWNNLGSALDARGESEQALAAFDQAISLRPAFAQAHNNRGNTLKNLGKLNGALAAYERAIELDPANQEVHSNRLYTLYFHPAYSSEMIYREHRRWNATHAAQYRPAAPGVALPEPAGRRLRIGYVAATFREHCQSFFMVPLLANHDHEQFEIFAYSDTVAQDALTHRLKGYCDAWRNISGLCDAAVAELIAHDRIDVLVDLSLHMSQNRLMVFARKPAPVQVTWLGYPGTTGLQTIDYRLTDPYLDPPGGGSDAFYSEISWRLPDTFWCYDPLASGPDVNELPAAKNGYVTFGCLNNFCKVNDGVLRLWSAVLRSVCDSRLLLLAPRAARASLLETFRENGVSADRVEFVDRASRQRYLALYHRIDIGLDTVPYNGHTTSLDSLWMGVPVITLVGDMPAGRAGWSQLNNLALPQFAATTEQEFVKLAANLADRRNELAELRSGLRARLACSPLTDGATFSRNVEHAYRAFSQALLGTSGAGTAATTSGMAAEPDAR